MEDQSESVANRSLIRQKGVNAREIIADDQSLTETNHKLEPLTIDELPAPLRRLYAKSAQDAGNAPDAATNGNNNSKKKKKNKKKSNYLKVNLNEPLLCGFALLRAAQLLNVDVYYIGLECRGAPRRQSSNGSGDAETGGNVSLVRSCSSGARTIEADDNIQLEGGACYRTILDELASYNPLQSHIDRHHLLQVACKLIKILLSLMAIIIGFNEILSTIVLCLTTIGTKMETSDSNSNNNNNNSMGLFVLVLVQFSSIYILFATIFNGHLIWNLFSRRQFLVSKRFQYKTMLKLLVFIYLEYIINVAFVCNLYDWDFTSNNIESGSYSVLANLRILVTFKDFEHDSVDILMTIISFARGIIRISPYVTINYAIICLKEHINTIRNQRLLTDSLKKRQKLRLVVGKTNRHRNESRALGLLNGSRAKKKKVNFVTEPMDFASPRMLANGQTARRQTLGTTMLQTISGNSPAMAAAAHLQNVSSNQEFPGGQNQPTQLVQRPSNGIQQRRPANKRKDSKDLLLERIEDFDELESYITNMYIFTGKLNRFMSSQGLTVFFIVHNLVISVSLIIPEAIDGGIVMVQLIRILLLLIAILPFIVGQSLSTQLEQLSKQIDRIIIQQHFIHRRRDNLVRIRELIHDIRVNCGGMLNFDVATGIKYLVVAFASAFFIEQEHYKLTRRHKADDVSSTMGWVVGFSGLTGPSAS